eukprot:COSAG06_NODE_31732_length_516_cov_1.510791_2_plen_48_part_01
MHLQKQSGENENGAMITLNQARLGTNKTNERTNERTNQRTNERRALSL